MNFEFLFWKWIDNNFHRKVILWFGRKKLENKLRVNWSVSPSVSRSLNDYSTISSLCTLLSQIEEILSKINENAVKDIELSSSHRLRKLGDVGSSPTGNDIFRVFSSIFKFVKKKKNPTFCKLQK